VPIIRKNNCIYATLGICHSEKHSRPKHVEKRNKHTKKNYAPIWIYLKDSSSRSSSSSSSSSSSNDSERVVTITTTEARLSVFGKYALTSLFFPLSVMALSSKVAFFRRY
jgi:hypothetical protein